LQVWLGWRLIVFVLVISLLSGLAQPLVDSWAHLGGTVMGFAVAGVRGRRPGGSSYRLATRLTAAIVGLAGAGACAYMLACGGCVEPPGGAHHMMLKILV